MRALITGILGFAGRFLARHLKQSGDEVFGLDLPLAEGALPPIGARIFPCDISERSALAEIIKEVRPEAIYHLAAISSPPDAAAEPLTAWRVNFSGTINLYEAVRQSGFSPRILFIGSAAEYGSQKDEKCLTEDLALLPQGPYAQSKAAADLASLAYFKAYGLEIIRLRPFNHTGPGQSAKFVASDFARAIALAEAGLGPKVVKVGSLSAQRDFLDVRDVVRAYYLAVEYGKPGEVYNIASGRFWSVKEILDTLLGMSRVSLSIEVEQARLRPGEKAVLLGSSEKFSKLTGWRPEIPLEKTLKDLLDWWRERIKTSDVRRPR